MKGGSSLQTTTVQDKSDSTPQTAAKDEGGGGGDDEGDGGCDEDDELDEDNGQEEPDTKKKKTRRLYSGSNKEAHGLMKMLMPFWMGHASGPAMADNAARVDINKLASACIRLYRIAGLVERAQDGINKQLLHVEGPWAQQGGCLVPPGASCARAHKCSKTGLGMGP